jgi:hypothetical protein
MSSIAHKYLLLRNERYNLPLYWFSNQFSLVGWNTGSALVTIGLVSTSQNAIAASRTNEA